MKIEVEDMGSMIFIYAGGLTVMADSKKVSQGEIKFFKNGAAVAKVAQSDVVFVPTVKEVIYD